MQLHGGVTSIHVLGSIDNILLFSFPRLLKTVITSTDCTLNSELLDVRVPY